MDYLSRRQLLKLGVAAAAGAISTPYFIPSAALASKGRPGANDRITVGVIGVGCRARLLIDQLPRQGQIASLADCYLKQCKAPHRYNDDRSKSSNNPIWRIHQDYRKLLDEKDIDAVIVATPDHGRVLPCILACQAGKDIYAEKPLSLYIEEGRALVKAARKHKRILQVGSQQRSMEINRIACEFVRNGGLGKIRKIKGLNFWAANPIPDLPKESVPDGLDWDQWLGQAPLRPYNHRLYSNWRRWWDYGGGDITNMGAHALDQVQWALGADDTGPVEFWPVTPGQKEFVRGQKPAAPCPVTPGKNGKVSYRYANGIQVDLELKEKHGPDCGAVFAGENGKLEINRNKITSNPKSIAAELLKTINVEQQERTWSDKTALWQAGDHLKNWLDCIVSRRTPNADVEIGHRSITVCHLVNIAREVGRKITWDPVKEQIVGDEEANKLVNRSRRKGFELPDVAS
ncbi:MAG: Gfo/Idh/MocA family oxidoreductase [Pirellulales bacterium]|nr:Gfo/Idh/MocA family oxidoreductase [Pirellulales bacterium]